MHSHITTIKNHNLQTPSPSIAPLHCHYKNTSSSLSPINSTSKTYRITNNPLTTGCQNVTNFQINIKHHSQWYKKWTHCWKDHVSFILIVATHGVTFFTASRLIPMKREIKWKKKLYKIKSERKLHSNRKK